MWKGLQPDPHPPTTCQTCKAAYRLVGIEGTAKAKHELHTLECRACGRLETRTVAASFGGLFDLIKLH